MMGFGYRLYPSYNGSNGVGGKGIDKMINELIANDDGLPALSTQEGLLFPHRSTGGAAGKSTHRQHSRIADHFPMVAVVILPDHLHCIWMLPLGDDDFSNRW